MADPIALERARLTARLEELREEEAHIRYTLDVLARLGSASAVASSGSGDQVRRVFNDAAMQSARQAVATINRGRTAQFAIDAVTADDNLKRVDDVIASMREAGWDPDVANEVETVRAALSRAVKDGRIARRGHGLYGPIKPTQESNTERKTESNSSADLTAALDWLPNEPVRVDTA